MSETTQEKVTPPSKEELIAFFQEQIEVKKVQLELHEINAKIAVARAEELKAMAFIAQMTNPQQSNSGGGTPHTVTQEDLDANPDLVDAGLQVGDEVVIPNDVAEQEPEEKSSKSRKLKKA
jgi:hypothetical protein